MSNKIIGRSRILSAAFVLAFSLATAPSAFAATQGTQGSTSTGSVNINASVPSRVRISGLTDVNLLNQDPTIDAVSSQDVCVWSNTATRGYSITATGSGSGSAFTLAGSSSSVPYSVEWADSTAQTTGTSLTTGAAVTGFTSSATQQVCSAGPSASASLIIKIASADLSTMQAAQTYTGTLTLLVTPE